MQWAYHVTAAKRFIDEFRQLEKKQAYSIETHRSPIIGCIEENWRMQQTREDEYAQRMTHEILRTLKISTADDLFAEVLRYREYHHFRELS